MYLPLGIYGWQFALQHQLSNESKKSHCFSVCPAFVVVVVVRMADDDFRALYMLELKPEV